MDLEDYIVHLNLDLLCLLNLTTMSKLGSTKMVVWISTLLSIPSVTSLICTFNGAFGIMLSKWQAEEDILKREKQ